MSASFSGSSWQYHCDNKGRGERNAQHDQVSKATDKKLEDAEEPALPINSADRKENLDHENGPKQPNDPAGENTRNGAIQSHRDNDDQHDGEISERVNVKRVNEVIDVKN